MNTGERLVAISGGSGTAGSLLASLASGATAGAILVAWSGLPSATAEIHLLADSRRAGGGADYETKNKRYIVRKGNKLLVFSRKEAALSVLDLGKETKKQKQKESSRLDVGNQHLEKHEIVLSEIKTAAIQQSSVELYQSLLKAKQYEAMLSIYERWLDEIEVEELILMVA